MFEDLKDLGVTNGAEAGDATGELLSAVDDVVGEFWETIAPEKNSWIRCLVSLLVTGRSPYCNLLSSRAISL